MSAEQELRTVDSPHDASGHPAPTHINVAYSDIALRNVCDIYLPDGEGGGYPVVVWIHGGAFRLGDKREPKLARRLLDAGMAIVSINYRLSQQAVWPAQLEDLTNVSRFIRENADRYGFDSDRIAAFGSSAGGHLSAMMGIALSDNPTLRIHAVVDWFGPIHFEHMDHDIGLTGVERGSPPNGEAGSPESDLIGAVVDENPTLAYQASPLSFLEQANSAPPFLIMHGDSDRLIGAPQSVRLHEALKGKFGPDTAEFHLLKGSGHGGGEFESEWVADRVIGFLKSKLG